MAQDRDNGYDAIFVGGGVIGLASAWRAAGRGARVCVLERDHPAAGATGVAAGMLAPAGEASWGEERLLGFNLESLRRWPDFADRLQDLSGIEVGFADRGALHVALDRDEAENLRRRYELHRGLGLSSEWLSGRACRQLEPGLATAVRGGARVPGEASVDPRRVVRGAAGGAGGRGRSRSHRGGGRLGRTGGSSWRVETRDGRSFNAANLVLAAGCWSGRIDWIPSDARPPVRPVKGEILTLRGPAREPACEGIVAGERVYLVPRGDGRLIVGATVEERGFDTTVTAGGVHELLREAYRLIPEIAELELLEATAGLRPGSPDNAPLIGPSTVEGLLLATGHFRNGVLQAPLTADCVAALLGGEDPPVDLLPFSPQRSPGAPLRPRWGSHERRAQREVRELLPDGATVEIAIEVSGAAAEQRGVAVAVDGEVVPRSAWEATRLREGQRIEVLAAIQGGAENGFELGGRSWGSRLIVGTGGFRSLEQMEEALIASGTEIVTVALRRVDPEAEGSVLELIRATRSLRAPQHRGLLHGPGCSSHGQACAGGVRDRLGEARGDRRRPHALPDAVQLVEAAEALVDDGFTVLPYTNDDPILARRLEDAGCAAVMPLGSPIGSGMGIRNPYNMRIIAERAGVPVILDAGIGTASDAALAMELGCDGVLLASSVSRAEDPAGMATAMRAAVEAGWAARQAGRIPRRLHAEASTPLEGQPDLS